MILEIFLFNMDSYFFVGLFKPNKKTGRINKE